MASPPSGQIIGLGSVIGNGNPTFISQDTSGTQVIPSGNYGWYPSSNLWIPTQVDSNGITQTSAIGSNVVVSEQSAAYAASTAASTQATLTFPLPTPFQASALYLVTISIPSSLATSFTANFENQVNIGSTLTPSSITSLTAPVGTNSYLIQGWMLGDGSPLCILSNTAAIPSTASGSVTVQVRKV